MNQQEIDQYVSDCENAYDCGRLPNEDDDYWHPFDN